MKEDKTPIYERSIFSWIFPGNIRLQIIIVILIGIAVVTRVFPLEMQKRIINEAIYLKKTDLLLLYCSLFIGSVIISSGLKFLINYLQTHMSQKVLANMRKDLYHHIITLPLNFFRKTGSGQVVASLMTELAPAGDFVGLAISTPVTSIFTLLAFAGYLFYLNVWLGAISLLIYPIVLFLVPRLQRRANRANARRVDQTRRISNKITESITGIHEIHGNGSYEIENKKYDDMVEGLRKTRITWTLSKQLVKVVNNFFTNLSPFLIFLVGGLLTIKGQLELGALVAFISAQEKLYDPWRELIDFFQLYQDASVSYKKTMGYFHVSPEHMIKPVDRSVFKLDGGLEVKDLTFETEDGIRLLDRINFTLKPGEHMALVGFSGSGKSTLALCVGQLYKYTGGHLLLGEKEVSELSKSDIVHTIGFVSQTPFIFAGTIEENILYSCASLNDGGGSDDDAVMPDRDEIIAVLMQTGIFADVLRFGLNTHLEYDRHKNLVKQILKVRESFRVEFGDVISDYVEFFNKGTYLYHSTVSENLIFGTPNQDSFQEQNLSTSTYFLSFLEEADLHRPLLSLGERLAKKTIDILSDLPPDMVFFQESPIQPDEVDKYKDLLEGSKDKNLHQISDEARQGFLELALRFIPGKHKMVGFPHMLENLILEGRALFREKITSDEPEAITVFDIKEYIYSQTILNNILFGKTTTEKTEAREKIDQSIIQLLIEEDLLETIVEIGMQFQVGTKGDRLSGGQRQKLAIARSFLKSPKLLIMDEATSGLDNKSQARIQNQLDNRWKGRSSLIAVVHRLDITKNFDKIAVLKAGKIVEMGTYDELIAKKGVLYDLATGKK